MSNYSQKSMYSNKVSLKHRERVHTCRHEVDAELQRLIQLPINATSRTVMMFQSHLNSQQSPLAAVALSGSRVPRQTPPYHRCPSVGGVTDENHSSQLPEGKDSVSELWKFGYEQLRIMGTGDYVCVTLSGAAPWGFTLEEGEVDNQRSFLVSQVEQGGRAFLAGIQDGDEVVSINGNPCADLTLLRASALIDTSTDSLQLCLKRNVFIPAEGLESEGRSLAESTTLNIISPDNRFQSPKELYISESQHDYGCLENDTENSQRAPSSCENHEGGAEWAVSPGDILELQVSLSKHTLSDVGSTALGSAHGIEGELSTREVIKALHKTTATSFCTPCPVREPLGQHGVVVTPTSALGQGGGRPAAAGSIRSREGHPEGQRQPNPSEEASGGDDSEGDQEQPNKHRARHARLRRNESISEKQLKEAKSKCKRIALLLTAAPSNPNNKGVLMFKKHRQRAKKYTLVSYGTGEDEQEYSDEEDEDDGDQEIPAPEITFLASINSEPDKPFFRDAASSKCVLSLNLDNALLDIERNLHNQAEMESLPDTKGKGALMFAQRRQRMDEISAEHEELRRQGMPVEGVQETNKRAAELSYMQSTTEGHTYMDQQYHQEQKQMQQYSANINGMNQQQTNEIQCSLNNRTAKPFTAENMVATPYSHGISGTSQDLAAQGEQIASRDERISTPAIKTSFLLDARRRNTGKPMFTFKESPKMSPNPELLNLLNRSDKKLGFESGPEEDYLSLGAEACNFLQSQRIKPKIPPPVAPKPVINPNSPPCPPPQPQGDTWPPAQAQLQTHVDSWTSQSQQTSANVSVSKINNRPSPKPWQPQQNASQNLSTTPPSPPRRMQSFTIGQRPSLPVNPMATVLNPKSSPGSAFEMPVVKGKGADMFAKRQSRMEKFVVDSDTVEANKASRSTSPAASLPNEWKYTPNALGRSFSLSPPARVPSTGQKSAPASSFSKPPTSWQTSRLEKGFKTPTPWEAASRHPLGLVDEAFQDLQQSLASNVHLAAQRKILPEPPAEWKARVSYQAPHKTGNQTWSQSCRKSPNLPPSFVSPTRRPVYVPTSHAGYRSLPRQWQPHKYEANLRPATSPSGYTKPVEKYTCNSTTWRWRL
ncbi:Synaptopodin-2 [Oryzias melastigma]|uniref:Synaptopodin-2 n=1 Tax=Oryzias melastigma TaxID=30732 RepID=A0A834FQ30_ORYME|nr:Synaptopodin-2 [Oryzias melastigma]